MKTITISLALLSLLLIGNFKFIAKTTTRDIKTETGIVFFTGTWQQALSKAKKENKSLFLDAYASWCGPCKMLKRRTFTDRAVSEFYNQHFINVEMDMEKGEGVALSKEYAISAYPTLIYLDPAGKLIAKTTGFHPADEFLAVGKKVIANK